eukprot:scaffold37716_cov63-Phaeocystis_antarctica.AAC.2
MPLMTCSMVPPPSSLRVNGCTKPDRLAATMPFCTATGEKKYEYTPTPTAVCRAAVTLYLVRVGAGVGARVLAES